jgi:hypothetical protein
MFSAKNKKQNGWSLGAQSIIGLSADKAGTLKKPSTQFSIECVFGLTFYAVLL